MFSQVSLDRGPLGSTGPTQTAEQRTFHSLSMMKSAYGANETHSFII